MEQGIINNIISQEAESQLGRIEKQLIKLEGIIASVNSMSATPEGNQKAYADMEKSILAVQKAEEELRQEQLKSKALEEQLAQQKIKTAEQQKKTIKLTNEEKEAQRESNRIKKLTEQVNHSAEGSYNKLNAQYKLNVIQLNKMTEEERKSTAVGQQLEAETKSLRDKMISLNESTSDHTLKVGRYTDAISGLPGPLGAAATSVKTLSKSFVALLANPIVLGITAIIGVVAALFKAFKSTDEGAVKLAGTWKAITNVVDILLDRLDSFRLMLVDLVKFDFSALKEHAKDAFDGIGKSISNAATSGRLLIETMDDIDDREKASLIHKSNLRKEIAALTTATRDKTLSDKERIKAGEEAKKKEIELLLIDKRHAEERLKASTYDLWMHRNNIKIRYNELNAYLDMDEKQLTSERQKNKAFAEFYNKNEEAFQALQKQKSEYIDLDTDYLEGTRRLNTTLSGLKKEITDDRNKKAIEQQNKALEQQSKVAENVAQSLKPVIDKYKEIAKDESMPAKERLYALQMAAALEKNSVIELAKVKKKVAKGNAVEIRKIEIETAQALEVINKQLYTDIQTWADKANKARVESHNATLDKINNILKSSNDDYLQILQDNFEREKDLRTNISDLNKEITEGTWDFAREAASAYFDWYNEKLENQSEKYEEEESRKLEALENTYKSGIISQAEYEAQRNAIQDEADTRQDDIDKKSREAEKQAFLIQQAVAIAKIWAEAYKAYALAQTQAIAFPVLAPFYEAYGTKVLVSAGINTAILAAQSIPYFKDGGEMDKDGLAIVGDGYKTEYMVTPKGKIYTTPDIPTVVPMERGTTIYPDASSFFNEYINKMIMVNPMMDTKNIERKLDKVIDAIENSKQPIQRERLIDYMKYNRMYGRDAKKN